MARPGSRGRRWAIVSTTLGSILLVATVVIFRDRIQEEWWVSRLSVNDPEARKIAAAKLAGVGRERGAGALLEILRARRGPGDEAVDSLGKIFTRVGPRAQAEIVRGLLEAVRFLESADTEWKSPEDFNPNLMEVLDGLQPRTEEVFAALRKESTSENRRNCNRAISLLVKAWPHCRTYLTRCFTDEPLEKVLELYRSFRWLVLDGMFPSEDPDVSRSFALEHPKPEIRAVSLAFHVLCSSGPNSALGTETLRQVYSNDPHPLVRTAAIRIAGWIGDAPGNLDLKSLLFQEKDSRLLEEVIQARIYWIDPFARGRSLEVCDGAVVPWSREDLEARRLEEVELERLKEILKKEKAPSLRDAASLALARVEDHLWKQGADGPTTLPALKIHEWGVWRDGGDRLLPAEDLVADLPAFVHRSRVTAKNLRRHRQGNSVVGFTAKPVVFCYSPEPVTVRLRVGFRGGRPWTFYPEITDYVEGFAAEDRENTNGRSTFESKGLNPPWPLEPEPAAPEKSTGEDSVDGFPKPPEGELRRRYSESPWIIPYRGGDGPWGSMGVEWLGLRIGYGSPLEGAFPPAEAGSWWTFLREVPSAPVALRGNHEQFLFYDGAIQLPSPVSVHWVDGERKSLRLRPRPLRDYPPDLELVQPPLPTRYLPGLFVIRKEPGGPPQGRFLPHVPPGAKPITVDLGSLPLDEQGLRSQLDASLRGEGLTPDESRALLRTWEKEFFGPGLRVLTVLPDWVYQLMLPMIITPEPGELVRVGVVWKECQGLEVDSTAEREAVQKGSPTPRQFKSESRELQFTEEVLHPEPSGHLALTPDGLLSGILPGTERALLSGDGKRLAFARHQAASPGIYLADLESMALTRLVNLSPEMFVDDYSVSYDGDQIAFIAEGGRFRVRVASLQKREVVEVYSTGDQLIPSWIRLAADGKRLVFFENRTPVVVDLESRRATFIEFPGSKELRYPVFTSDGSRLVLLAGPESAGTEDWKALVVDLGQGTFVETGGGMLLLALPCLSAAGSRLLFASMEDQSAFITYSDLASGSLVRLASLRVEEIETNPPFLTADGRTVLFLNWSGRLWTTDLETGRSREVASPEGPEILRFNASADGRRVLLWTRDFGVADSERFHFLNLK